MKKAYLFYLFILLTMASCVSSRKMEESTSGKSDVLSEKNVTQVAEKVSDWQLRNLHQDNYTKGWKRGAFMAGLMASYRLTKQDRYLYAAQEMSQENNWKPGKRSRHADDQVVCQTYTELFFIKQDSSRIKPCREVFDVMIDNPTRGPVVGWSKAKNWSWCDALFMAPPGFAEMYEATGEEKYLDFMNMMWWDTYNHLYDKEEHLFYRDGRFKVNDDGSYLSTPHGKKMFWSRGNGWVIAGIARILNYMPENYQDYDKYVHLYKQMIPSLAQYQQQDGLWRSSLNDPAWYPTQESSGSSFITYAMAWGINNGFLDRDKYLPKVESAWKGLVHLVEPNGKLGHAQDGANRPEKVRPDNSQEYATGAFLLAAEEVAEL